MDFQRDNKNLSYIINLLNVFYTYLWMLKVYFVHKSHKVW